MFLFSSSVQAAQPNIIVILADDLGWGDVSCNQPEGKIRTPAIDAVASEGMRFTNAHAPHAVCTPTRSTIASTLKEAGYRTGAFGKWHIGLGWKPKFGDPGDFHFGSQIHGPGVKKALLDSDATRWGS